MLSIQQSKKLLLSSIARCLASFVCLSRPFIADCQNTSLPAIERTAGTVKVRCTVVSLFLNALDMLAIRTILCRRMFLPVYAIFCDSCHIIPRDSYARPTVWGMKSPAGEGGAWGASAILTRANESSILKCHVQVGEARHYATFFCSRPRTIKDSGPFSYSGVGCYAMTFKPGTFSSMNVLMFFMASPFHAPPSASTRANFTPSLSLQRNTKELSGCSTSVKVR